MGRMLHQTPTGDLDKLPLLTDLATGPAEYLAAAAERMEVARGQDIPSDIGILVSGIAGVRRQYADGQHLYCALFHGGDLFDLRRTERQRQGILLAVTDVTVLCLERATLAATGSAHPEIADFHVRQLREHGARLRDHCADLAFKTPVERLASAILEFRRWPEAEATDTDEGLVLRLPVRRTDIASYMGMKPETVSRALKQLARDGILRKAGRDSLQVLDLPALRMTANGGQPRRH